MDGKLSGYLDWASEASRLRLGRPIHEAFDMLQPIIRQTTLMRTPLAPRMCWMILLSDGIMYVR